MLNGHSLIEKTSIQTHLLHLLVLSTKIDALIKERTSFLVARRKIDVT